MRKVPTAQAIIEKHYNMDRDEDGFRIMYPISVEAAMIEFAKLHVKAALEEAAANSRKFSSTPDTVLASYPEENIV